VDVTVVVVDSLKDELHRRLEMSNEHIVTAARLIAPVIDEKDDWEAGYKWIIDQLRSEYEYMYTCIHIYIHKYIHIYIYTYLHQYTNIH
jgi:hypothetical protein